MTVVQITPAAVETQSLVLQLVVIDPHVAAQHAGDQAYELVQQAGLSNEEMADAYHVTYVETLLDLGVVTACACAFCANLRANIH